jgi:hypothetical protein
VLLSGSTSLRCLLLLLSASTSLACFFAVVKWFDVRRHLRCLLLMLLSGLTSLRCGRVSYLHCVVVSSQNISVVHDFQYFLFLFTFIVRVCCCLINSIVVVV